MGRKDRLGGYLLLCLCYTSSVIAENSYLFISPKTIRPGHDLIIQGSLLVDPVSPVEVIATLEKAKPRSDPFGRIIETAPTTSTLSPVTPEPLSSAYATLTGKQTQDIVLPIPDNLPEGEYDLKIVGTGGLEFDNSTKLDYDGKSHSIFVQTDKAIYKPGQTVHFRVFGITPDLKVVPDKMDVDIYDPIGNKIMQWDVAQKDLMAEAGIFEAEMPMSDSPVLGDWKIKITQGKEKAEKAFTVDEYVLPKFEVSVDLPSYGRTTDKEFEGKVTAKYTYGKPVKGMANIRIKPEYPRYDWINGTKILKSGEIELQVPIDGTATFTVPMRRLKDIQEYLDRSYLVFQANVTETLTGSKLSSPEEKLQFFDQPIKIDFPDSLPENFKPGLSYLAVLKVAEQDDTPPTIQNGKASVNISFYRPIVTTTTSTTTTTTLPPEPIMIDGKMVMPERIIPEVIIRPGGWWWPREQEEKQPERIYPIPSDGLIEIPLDVPSDVTRVDIAADYDGVRAYKTLRKSHSPSDSYLQLRLLNERPKTGDRVGIQVRSTDLEQKEAVYQIMSKGNVVSTGTVDLSTGILNFLVTADMAPKAKLMIYYVRPDGEVVADGLTFNVEGIFENQVSIDFDSAEVKPADRIKLTVNADPGSKVNVLAVDKSVLLLKSGNDVTKDDVKKELESYDSTSGGFFPCGWFCLRWPMPASGDDAHDVFNNAGLAYITDALVYSHEDRDRRPMPMFRSMAFNAAPAMAFNAGPAPAPSALAPVQRVRKLFPETWLWKTKTTERIDNDSIHECAHDNARMGHESNLSTATVPTNT